MAGNIHWVKSWKRTYNCYFKEQEKFLMTFSMFILKQADRSSPHLSERKVLSNRQRPLQKPVTSQSAKLWRPVPPVRSTIQLLHCRRVGVQKDWKKIRRKKEVCCEIESPRKAREATLIKSYQHGWLNMTWARMAQ